LLCFEFLQFLWAHVFVFTVVIVPNRSMKTFAVLLLALFALSSCDDTSSENRDNIAAKVNEVENRAINGQQWRITNFTNSNLDRTEVFNGYIFEFDSNNLLTSTNGSDNLSGSWSVKNTASDGEAKTEFDNIDFLISFTNPAQFEALTGNWEIVSITDSRIELRNLKADSQNDVIRFERI
jgi:hypothetical protein